VAIKSPHRQILENLRDALLKINPQAGYGSNVEAVTFRFLLPEEVKKDYTICIVAGDAALTPLMINTYTTNSVAGRSIVTRGREADGWRIVLVGYLRTKADEDKSGETSLLLLDFLNDVLKKIMSDRLVASDSTLCLNGIYPKGWEIHTNVGQNIHAFNLPLGIGFDL